MSHTQDNKLKKVIYEGALITFILTILFLFLYRFLLDDFYLTLSISLGTTCYHFVIRLLLGYLCPLKKEHHSSFFDVSTKELKLYELLGIKKWKDHMPTYNPSSYKVRMHELDQLIETMKVSEYVHWYCLLFSFFPLLETYLFGDFMVFFVTSLIAGIVECMFIMMQRYNRGRITQIQKRRLKKVKE